MKAPQIIALAATLCFSAALSPVLKAQQNEDPDLTYATDLLKVGTKAPDFTVGDINRNEVTFSKISKKKYVLLDFWATWCPDCRAEVPEMKRLHEKYGDKVLFVGISMDTKEDQWKKYVADNDMDWLQLSELKKWKQGTVVPELYNVHWIPTVYIIDSKGKVLLGTVVLSKVEATLKEICE